MQNVKFAIIITGMNNQMHMARMAQITTKKYPTTHKLALSGTLSKAEASQPGWKDPLFFLSLTNYPISRLARSFAPLSLSLINAANFGPRPQKTRGHSFMGDLQ